MFKELIAECRALLENSDDQGPDPAEQQTSNEYRLGRNKHDRAAVKIGHLLSTPIENLSRKRMRKLIPHLTHHFSAGHGKGDGDYQIVDADDLATLGRHAEKLSAHADSLKRMSGPAHNLAAHLLLHVAGAHEKLSKYWRDNGNDEAADLHDNERGRYHEIHRKHRKRADRHGYY